MDNNQYSEEQAQQILKRAVGVSYQDTVFTRDQLVEMAQEMGISTDALQLAERDWLNSQKDIEELKEFDRHRVSDFRTHLLVYAINIPALFLVNLLITGLRPPWFLFAALAWGIALAIHAWTTYQKDGDSYEQEFQNWKLKRQIKQKIYRKLLG